MECEHRIHCNDFDLWPRAYLKVQLHADNGSLGCRLHLGLGIPILPRETRCNHSFARTLGLRSIYLVSNLMDQIEHAFQLVIQGRNEQSRDYDDNLQLGAAELIYEYMIYTMTADHLG